MTIKNTFIINEWMNEWVRMYTDISVTQAEANGGLTTPRVFVFWCIEQDVGIIFALHSFNYLLDVEMCSFHCKQITEELEFIWMKCTVYGLLACPSVHTGNSFENVFFPCNIQLQSNKSTAYLITNGFLCEAMLRGRSHGIFPLLNFSPLQHQ